MYEHMRSQNPLYWPKAALMCAYMRDLFISFWIIRALFWKQHFFFLRWSQVLTVTVISQRRKTFFQRAKHLQYKDRISVIISNISCLKPARESYQCERGCVTGSKCLWSFVWVYKMIMDVLSLWPRKYNVFNVCVLVLTWSTYSVKDISDLHTHLFQLLLSCTVIKKW